jgi:tetratricopeptide (TPR) repeat protein
MGIALWIGNMANLYHDRRQYDKALVGYQESMRIHEDLGQKLWSGIALGNLGNLYRDTGKYGQALECYGQALESRHSMSDKPGVAIVAGMPVIWERSIGSSVFTLPHWLATGVRCKSTWS